MFVVKNEQMETFNDCALELFIDNMQAHSREFCPRYCCDLNDIQLRLLVKNAIEQARVFGLTFKGPVQFYLDLVLLFGSHFPRNPLFANFAEILHDDSNQMFRAEQLYERTSVYLKNADDDVDLNTLHLLKSLHMVENAAASSIQFDLQTYMFNELLTHFPARTKHVANSLEGAIDTALQGALTNHTLKAFVASAYDEANKYSFNTVRGKALLIVLMFSFGLGCPYDPLFPWIKQSIDEQSVLHETKNDDDGEMQLENAAIRWFEKMLACNQIEQNGQIL